MNDIFPSPVRALFGGSRDLEDMLPYLFEENNHAIATRSGSLVSVVKIAGVNPFTASEGELAHIMTGPNSTSPAAISASISTRMIGLS